MIKPYSPRASAKIKIRIIPTKIASYWALALTPASPTIPIARPAAYEKLSLWKDGYKGRKTATESRGEVLISRFVTIGRVSDYRH